MLVNREGLMGDMMSVSCRGHNSHKMIEFSILLEVRKMLQPTSEDEDN